MCASNFHIVDDLDAILRSSRGVAIDPERADSDYGVDRRSTITRSSSRSPENHVARGT